MVFRHAQLDNGLEIVAETHETALSATVGFFVQTGARDETPEVAGVSHFLEHMLFKGTPRRSADDVNRELDEMGATSNAYTSEEQTVYYATVLPELLDRAVDLLGDMMRPSLRDEDFEVEKQVILEEILMYEDQPPFGADEKSREYFLDGHPLSHSVLGSCESITRLDNTAMRTYHAARYAPSNIVLAVCGRIDFDRLVNQAERICGSWKNDSEAEKRFPRELSPVRGKHGFHRLQKSGAVQQYALLMADAPDAAADDTRRYGAMLLANVLGDDVGSRLYWELVDNGRADSAWLGCYEYLDAGLFLTMVAANPETMPENLDIVRKICRDVEEHGISREELDRAKSKVLSRVVLSNERPRGRLFSVGGEWSSRHRYRTVREEMETIRRVTLDDLHAVLAEYPLSDPLTVTVGDDPDAC